MAVLIEVDVPATEQQYDALSARLQAAGPEMFAGCLCHVAVVEDGRVKVADLWESQAALEAFQQRMMPIAAELGFPRSDTAPSVTEVHAYWVPGMTG